MTSLLKNDGPRLIFIKKCDFQQKKIVFAKTGLGHAFFHVVARFLWSYAKSEITSRFLAKFCFRWTYCEVCTTKIHQKCMRFRFRFLIYFGHWRHDKPHRKEDWARMARATLNHRLRHQLMDFGDKKKEEKTKRRKKTSATW